MLASVFYNEIVFVICLVYLNVCTLICQYQCAYASYTKQAIWLHIQKTKTPKSTNEYRSNVSIRKNSQKYLPAQAVDGKHPCEVSLRNHTYKRVKYPNQKGFIPITCHMLTRINVIAFTHIPKT